MKAFRAAFYALMGLAFLAGRINGIRAYYLLFFFQLFLLLACLALIVWTAYAFSYKQNVAALRYVKGGLCTLRLGIYNDKPFPFTMLKVYVAAVSPGDTHVFTINLMPNTHYEADLGIPLPYRGEYEIGLTHLVISDIFGLCSLRFDVRKRFYHKKLTIGIYPRLILLRSRPAQNADLRMAGGTYLALSPLGDTFAATRLYLPGDAQKHIHWKTSLHSQELHSKLYDTQLEAESLIILNNIPWFDGEETRFYADCMCESAAAAAHALLRRGHPVRMAGATLTRPATQSGGINGFDELYSWLAYLPFDATPDACAQVILREAGLRTRAKTLFLFTACLDAPLAGALQSAAANGLKVTLMLIDYPQGEARRILPGIRRVHLRRHGDNTQAMEEAL